jgi:hypothetical protein
MGTSDVKQVIVELTRGGCRVETLLYEPPAVTFRTPNGARCALTSDANSFRLAHVDAGFEQVVSFPTLREALREALRGATATAA